MSSPHLPVVPPEYVSPIRRVLLRGAPYEPKDVFSRALFLNARGAVVSEGVLHVSVMGVALPRALLFKARGAFAAKAGIQSVPLQRTIFTVRRQMYHSELITS